LKKKKVKIVPSKAITTGHPERKGEQKKWGKPVEQENTRKGRKKEISEEGSHNGLINKWNGRQEKKEIEGLPTEDPNRDRRG